MPDEPVASDNPYATPDHLPDDGRSASRDGSLSRFERRSLILYRKWLWSPPTMGQLVVLHFPVWILSAGVALAVYLLAVSVLGTASVLAVPYGCVIAGLVIGFVTRDIAICRALVRFWPTLRDVLDEDKIAAKLEGREPRS
jgi:hypothetical protein